MRARQADTGTRIERQVVSFLDQLRVERGLSANTLASYRFDPPAVKDVAIERWDADGLGAEPGRARIALQQPPEVLPGEAFAPLAHEELAGLRLEPRTERQPGADPVFGSAAEGANSPSTPLSQARWPIS